MEAVAYILQIFGKRHHEVAWRYWVSYSEQSKGLNQIGKP